MDSKVGKQDGSAAANDPGSTPIRAAMSAAAAAAGPHEPATVQMKDNERNPAMAIHDLGAGPGADSDMSSSPSSPAKAPPQKRVHRSASQPARDRSRERRSEGGTARVSKSFAPTRLVHRKVEAAQPTAAQASWQGGRFQQIDAQFDADREAIQKLQQAVMALDARSLIQHEQLLKLQKTDEDAKRNAFEM